MARHLGFLAWKNDLAWMEDQKGAKWLKTIHDESSLFKESLHGLDIKGFKRDLQLEKARAWHWKGWAIENVNFSRAHIWTKGSFKKHCWAADISNDGKWFAAAVQDKTGFERFSVEIYPLGSKISHKKTIQGCGPDVFFYNNSLVFLGSSRDLRYDSVKLWDPYMDKESEIYRLTDQTENLELGRGEDGCVFVLATDFVYKRLGLLTDTDILWKPKAKDIFVVNFNYLILNQVSHTTEFSGYILESMSLKGGWAVTRNHGIKTLWSLSGSRATIMITVWGEVHFDSREPTRLSITDVRYEPYVVYTDTWKLSSPKPYDFPMTQYQNPTSSFVVYPTSDVKALVVIAYSAYGIPTRIGQLVQQWRPLLLRGWAIAAVCLPGSGDHDIKWKEAGQRQNRKVAIDLLRDTVQSLQEEIGVSPKNTCLYGRSAGGLIVISTATLYRGLVGALYVESPYVDVLRTMTDNTLPLTTLETKEFGIGEPLNILATQAWSPMEHIPANGLPELFVIARCDTQDLEVFPYEVVKWIKRIRGPSSGQKKLLFVDHNKGHFATSKESRAEDLALLDSWRISPDRRSTKNSAVRTKNRSTKYKMARRMSRKMSRKSRKSRKASRKSRANRKNRMNKMNKMNKMEGGRRRRGTRKGRKARKGTRRH